MNCCAAKILGYINPQYIADDVLIKIFNRRYHGRPSEMSAMMSLDQIRRSASAVRVDVVMISQVVSAAWSPAHKWHV